MTKLTISLIIAVLFIIVSLSTPLIPCRTDDDTSKTLYKDWKFCSLDGEKIYYGTEKLSDPYIGGIVTAGIIFLISFLLLNIIFPSKKI